MQPAQNTDSSDSAPATFNGARLLAPYNPNDPQYATPFVWSIGPNKESKNWRPDEKTPDVRTMFQRLSDHRIGPKDGLAFVTGDMVKGQRFKTAVKAQYAIGLDFDKGTAPAVIDKALLKFGHAAIRYTTHSNGKTHDQFKRDELQKFAPDQDIDTPLMRRFVSEKHGWDPSVVKSVEFVNIEHTTRGIMVQITHKPMHKNRVVIPLAKPFVIADVASSQQAAMDKWKKLILATVDEMGLGYALDLTGTDTSRLFYFPRHAENMPFDIAMMGGPLFDWESIEIENPYEQIAAEVGKGSSKSKTPAGRDLGRWSMKAAHGFQIVDVLEAECPDKIRGKASSGVDIECPFDGEHSNAGDPNDRACFAVNAGEGNTDWFTISCRHDSCRDYTMLDMLGRMITEGWFKKEILGDENFNEAVPEDAPQPEIAQKIDREDKARAAYLDAIDKLTPADAFKPDVIEHVVRLILDVGLDDIAETAACHAMKGRLGIKQSAIEGTLKKHKQKRAKENALKKPKQDSGGRLIFRYAGGYSFPDAVAVCARRLKAENEKLPRFTQMTGALMRLTEEVDQQTGTKKVSFVPMSAQATWAALSERISFVKTFEGDELEPDAVPERIANYVYETAYKTFPATPEVMSAPFYKSDGSLVLTEGYHFNPNEGLNYYLVLNGLDVCHVPLEPTYDQMVEARDWLKRELLSDFPFLDTDTDENGKIRKRREPSEAHAFALFLTPIMRRMIPGHTPLIMISKPQPNVGATFLAHCAMQVVDGEADTKGLTYTKSEEEMQKSLVSVILSPRKFMFFDNVREFDNRILISSLTSREVGGRVLGGNREAYRPNNFVWLATGIKPYMSAEMQRWTCHIELNPERPSTERRKYRHKNLADFIAKNRGLAIRHLLTMVEYWQSQGSPEFTARELSSYENWSRIIGGVLECCGVTGFLDNAQSAPPDMTQTRENKFLAEFATTYGTDVKEADAIFEWAEGCGYRVSDGRMVEDRKETFLPALFVLCGRTIEVQKRRYGFHYQRDDVKGFLFGMHEIEANEPGEEDNKEGKR